MSNTLSDKGKLFIGITAIVFLMSLVIRLDECKVCEPFNVHMESISSNTGVYIRE